MAKKYTATLGREAGSNKKHQAASKCKHAAMGIRKHSYIS